MASIKTGLIQVALKGDAEDSPEAIRQRMIEAHVPFIEEAAAAGVQVLCFQEVFNQPYFCPSQDPKWYAAAEPVPDGPTTQLMCEYARKHGMVIVVPIYEQAMTGVYYNTAAVIDADGTYLGKYRKSHIPQVAGFYEKFFFKPGNSGWSVFDTAFWALVRIEQGNISSVKSVGSGVFECRIEFGPGYRAYFGKDGEMLIVLLGGGTKRRQQQDIETARVLWREYKRRRRSET